MFRYRVYSENALGGAGHLSRAPAWAGTVQSMARRPNGLHEHVRSPARPRHESFGRRLLGLASYAHDVSSQPLLGHGCEFLLVSRLQRRVATIKAGVTEGLYVSALTCCLVKTVFSMGLGHGSTGRN
jgi:hypothetical protein